MKNKWGFKVPIAACDKGYRAIYRAFTKYCTMRDISFYSCVELMGPREHICEIIGSNFVPTGTGFSLNSNMYKNTRQEGSLQFYKAGEYPYGYIGHITFLWMQENQLWLWVHPSFKEEVISQLCAAFKLYKITVPLIDEVILEATIDEAKLKPKGLTQRSQWINASTDVSLTDLDGALNRIRLCGPASTGVLKEILHSSPFDDLWASAAQSVNSTYWWQTNREYINALQTQNKHWDSIKGIHMVPYRSILCLSVRDPRIFLPEKRLKGVNDLENDYLDMDISESLPYEHSSSQSECPLRVQSLRQQLVQEKMSDAEFSRRRSELLIPGEMIDSVDLQ